jgi:hypothetical protein
MRRSYRAAILLSLSLSAVAQTAAPQIARAANRFLSLLDQKQRQALLFAFDDERRRLCRRRIGGGFVGLQRRVPLRGEIIARNAAITA